MLTFFKKGIEMRKRNAAIFVVMVALVLFFALPRADATWVFNDGGTHNIDYEIRDDVSVCYGTTVNVLPGGSIGGDIIANDESIITLVGSDFAIDGEPVDYGRYFRADYPNGTLTGTLANGEHLGNYFEIWADSSYHPCSRADNNSSAGLGSLVLLRKRRE